MGRFLTPKDCKQLKTRKRSRLAARRYDGAVVKAGLKCTQVSPSIFFANHSSVARGDLGQLMMLDPSALTCNLRPLLAARWFAKSRGADARCRLITIIVTITITIPISDGVTSSARQKRAAGRRYRSEAPADLYVELEIDRNAALHIALGD